MPSWGRSQVWMSSHLGSHWFRRFDELKGRPSVHSFCGVLKNRSVLPLVFLQRIVSARTKTHELHTLLPWNWKVENPDQGLVQRKVTGAVVAAQRSDVRFQGRRAQFSCAPLRVGDNCRDKVVQGRRRACWTSVDML
jgi:hypothetical protein